MSLRQIILVVASLLIFAADEAKPEPPRSVDDRDLSAINVGIRPLGSVTRKVAYYTGKEKVMERLFYKNGVLAEEARFLNNLRSGLTKQYYESGALFSESPYSEGLLDGVVKYYDEKGALLGQSEIAEGTGNLRTFALKSLSVGNELLQLRKGVKDGSQFKFAEFTGGKGLGCTVAQYRNGEPDGWCVTFNADGSILDFGYMRAGKLHGISMAYTAAGSVDAGYPKFHVSGESVTEAAYKDAARDDEFLRSFEARAPSALAALAVEAERTRVRLGVGP